MTIAALTNEAKYAWVLDHLGVVSHGAVIGMNKDSVALRIGDRLLLINRDQCFPTLLGAITFRMQQLTKEIAARQHQWTELAGMLGHHIEEAS